jgi:preprotein translocase subunit SecB
MAEQKNNTDELQRFIMKGQYIKDLSFENPNAPHTLIKPDEKPKVTVNVSLKAGKFNENLFELTMKIAARADGEANAIFIVELDYCAIIQLVNIPEERQEQVLFIDCAAMLFPFARRVLADVTRDGGFPPMLLEPIDFIGLYEYNKSLTPAKAAG